MKQVAVLGGGPAGASAAERLAAAGMKTVLLDEKLAWEKPCGGGVTYKAYEKYPFLIQNDVPKRLVSVTQLAAPGTRSASMKLRQPMLIYSRYELNRMLLERAERAGAQIEKEKVLSLSRAGGRWQLATRHGAIEADFCIIATGARNPLREVGTRLTAADTMLALGYYVPEEQEHIDIQFLSQLEGYIWVFPRCGHLSVGICGRGEPAYKLRARLEGYMQERGISWKNATFYSHVLPCLGKLAWRHNRVAGPGWIAVGDAGGWWIPSPARASTTPSAPATWLPRWCSPTPRRPRTSRNAYRALLQRDFAADLELGSALARRIFSGRFLFASVPQRMIQFMRRSPRFHELMQDLFDGTQGYLDLKARLLRNLHGTMFETAMSFLLSKVVPGET